MSSADAYVTRDEPRIIAACGSQKNVYLPRRRRTVQIVSVRPRTVVALFTRGPLRWKLWIRALSSTLMRYVPARIVLGGRPVAVFSSILKRFA